MIQTTIWLRFLEAIRDLDFSSIQPQVTIVEVNMSTVLVQSIADLASVDEAKRLAAAGEIYRLGRAAAGSAVSNWWTESELSSLLLAPHPAITVGLAVQRETFTKIRAANGSPRLAEFP